MLNKLFKANVFYKRLFTTNPIAEQPSKTPSVELKDAMKKKIHEIVTSRDIVLFMKGTAKEPLCGFSQYALNTIAFYNVGKFQIVDTTVNKVIPAALKEYSDWPTIPQLFVKGKLVGGFDIIKEMHMNGKFEELLRKEGLIAAK